MLRQLRYTGMLETVHIRQSGYSCKYSFQVRLFFLDSLKGYGESIKSLKADELAGFCLIGFITKIK